MRLECYKIYDTAPEIVPGRSDRAWMDAFVDRHPYRCLPLTMANATGWEILCPIDIKVIYSKANLPSRLLSQGGHNR